MRKPDLTAYIANKADISSEKAQQVMAAILDQITLALSRDDVVSLVGFGTFDKRNRAARSGKNPQTGAAIEIAASNTVGFKPGKALRDAIN
ncbi:MAG TPA: HU family DNA-binding protein [Spongiibacteraceae bacterium]|nr:HU family DNA-binding protein [Spongiibacteraceae bacterium]